MCVNAVYQFLDAVMQCALGFLPDSILSEIRVCTSVSCRLKVFQSPQMFSPVRREPRLRICAPSPCVSHVSNVTLMLERHVPQPEPLEPRSAYGEDFYRKCVVFVLVN